tara:strand:- start:52 stop:309 length:258 start_codon:yes stop_codon:yes gene_type:complete
MRKVDLFIGLVLCFLTFRAYADDIRPLELQPVIIEAEKEQQGCQQNPDGTAVGALVVLFLGAYLVGFLVGRTDRQIENESEDDVE